MNRELVSINTKVTNSQKVKSEELAIMSVILGGWGVKINDKNNQ